MNKLLLKILESSLFPASMFIVSKVIGLLLANYFFNLNWSINQSFSNNNIFTIRFEYDSISSIITSNTFSNAIMFFSIFMFVVFKTYQAYKLHLTHIDPSILNKLVNFNLFKIIKNSFDLYNESIPWFIFLWLVNVVIIINSIIGISLWECTIIFIILSTIVTSIFLLDLNLELKKSNNE